MTIGDFPISIITKLLLSFSFLIILPGILFQIIALKERSIINLIGGGFLFGFLFFIPMSFISYLCHLPLYSIVIGQVLISMVLFFLKNNSFKEIKISNHKKHFLILLIIGFSSGLLSTVMGWHPRGDASIHLQVIRNLAGDFVVNQPHYSLVGQEKIPDHIYDAYYILLASVQYITKIELTLLWHYSSAVFSFFLPFSIYYLGFNLKRDNRFSLFLVFSFVFHSIIFHNIMYGSVYDALVYPNRFYLWLMMPVVLGLTINLLKNYSKTKLAICALSVVSFLFIHQSGFLFYFIIIGGFLSIALINKEYELVKSILILIGLIIIISLPILLIKLSGNIQYITSSSDQIWHSHYKFFYLTNDFFAFSFSKYFYHEMWFGIIISIISFFYIRKKKESKDRFVNYLIISTFFLPFLIIFNPFLVPFLSKLISYVAIVRMFRIPMYFLAFAIFLWFIFKKIDKKYNSKVIYAQLISLLIIIAFNFFLNFTKNGFKHSLLPISEILHVLPDNSIILSDKLTSSDIATFKFSRHLSIQFNGAIDLIDLKKQNKFIEDVLHRRITGSHLIHVLKEYSVEYIIVDHNKYNPIFSESSIREIYFNDKYTVYNVL